MKSHAPTLQAFPFTTNLSLAPLIDYWQKTAADSTSTQAILAQELLSQLDEVPALKQPIDDPALLEEHRGLVQALMGAVFPVALWDEVLMAVTAPFVMEPFYTTPRFDQAKIFERGLPAFIEKYGQDDEKFIIPRTQKAYLSILQACYGVVWEKHHPMVFGQTDDESGLDKYFKIDINPRFNTIRPIGELPVLSQAQIQELLNDPFNFPLWMELLPPEKFVFEGFVVLSATEVTDQSVLSVLKDDLLQKDAMATSDKIDQLQRRLRTLLRHPDLDLGLISLKRDDFDAITGARPIGRSLLLGEHGAPQCQYKSKSYYAQAYERTEPLLISDLDTCDVCTGYEYHLKSQNYRTLILSPLRVEGKVVGILELASPHPSAINALSTTKLAEATPLIATAMKRFMDEQDDRVQAVMKEHYTAIHPAVEWRFRETAQRFLEERATNPMAQIEPIVFHDVYPLYGLSDIRNSSTHRGSAIQADLLQQIELANKVIVEASISRPLPILDEISFRLSQYAERIGPGASTEDETNVIDFLNREVRSLFKRIQGFDERVSERIDTYNAAVDEKLGVLYEQRKDFEDSVTLLNETIARYLNEQERHAQAMYPHYFELFKTDGVDYNIYIGGSIAEQSEFDMLYLRNMRLWQLMLMCGVEWELKQLKPTLPMPLDATHLILVQNTPLSIRFRMEEKQFDVDGAYNIRYEIVKKRIDKAVIRGTGERLTQPGQIAICYSQTRESLEYRRYLEYLAAKGYITGDIEDYELEPMQGVHGLKALRVTVSDEAPPALLHLDPLGVEISQNLEVDA